jgi:hypothetical protein
MPCTCAFRPPAGVLLLGALVVLVSLAPGTARADLLPTMFAPTGAASADFLGWSSGTAGDVNGDGYADVIAGAWANDTGGTNSGAAYVYFGGPKADDVADVTMYNIQAGGAFGISVGTAGDVNGDGYDDVIVGADYNDAGGENAGQAFLYFGGPGMDAVADLTFTGAMADDHFGVTAGTAGDVNGDGYDDVIVGAYGNDEGGTDAGRAYVYLGGASPNATADVVVTGTTSGINFAARVGTAGDVNGDGYDDFLVGAAYEALPMIGTYVGSVRVYYGGASPDAVADLRVTGVAAGDQFGAAMGAAGDVNGDGYADIVAGTRLNDAGGADAGQAYVFFGGASPDTVADLTLTGLVAGDFLGVAVGTAGDVNDDGYDDVIVGASLNDAAGTDAGAAYVYYGGASPDAVADATLTAEAAGDYFGSSVGTAGDVNGDGRADVVVGAYQNDAAAAAAGRVYVCYLDPPRAACRLDLSPLGVAAGDRLGYCVAAAGDVNGDGYGDFIVGAPRSDPPAGTDAGRAYVFFGGPALDAVADMRLSGAGAGDEFGYAVAGAGDVNGDGYDDVIVGAPFNDFAGADAGRAYVYLGGAAPNTGADLFLTGEAAYDRFGAAVGTAGRMNGDAYADLVVGAYMNDAGGDYAGRAYVYYGAAVPNATADLTLTGGAANDELGASVGTAGDVNGDGYDDLVVGIPLDDNAHGTNAGAAYMYYGGASPDATSDLRFVGEAATDEFGVSVGTAGDVNGDGYADVIVGAYYSDAGGTNSGRAYVFCGGADPDLGADVTMTGAAANDDFGRSARTAGDVNGDGYADVVVGAYGSDVGGSSAGQAYVYYGGVAMDPVADHTWTGAAGADFFGFSCATAGDVNADGFADVVVGAYGNDAGGTDAGAAYLYDFKRYFVLSPNGGETWTRNATESVSWLGAEPADLWLSADDGATWEPLQEGVGGSESNAAEVTAPNVVTDLALVKAVPHEVWVTGSDMSDSVFTIQATTGVEPGDAALRFRAPWPNPSSGVVRLGIELARPTVVTVAVLDVAGREVARPIAGEKFEAGKVTREWRPAGLAPGVYTVRATVGESKLTRRLVWLGGK